MNRKEIEHWIGKYDRAFGGELQEIEEQLTSTLAEQGYITQSQLGDVVTWKLDNQPGRRDRNIELVNSVPDKFIRLVSEAAFLLEDPHLQLKTLASIPGIGGATATVILAFYNPSHFAVGDRYMVDLLLGENRQMRMTDYPKLLDALKEKNPGGFDLRTVEKAYYQRYRAENEL